MADIKFPSQTNTKATPVDADSILIADSVDSNSIKDVTFAGLRDNFLIDDAGTATTDVWSGSKISTELSTQTHAAADITSGVLAHERGGLEADVSAFNGFVKISGGSTSAVAGPTTDLVGISDAQTLSNKTIDPSANTIDGDKLDITFTPSNYTPDSTPAEADDVNDLAAHLNGIDAAISTPNLPIFQTYQFSALPTSFSVAHGLTSPPTFIKVTSFSNKLTNTEQLGAFSWGYYDGTNYSTLGKTFSPAAPPQNSAYATSTSTISQLTYDNTSGSSEDVTYSMTVSSIDATNVNFAITRTVSGSDTSDVWFMIEVA